MNDELLYYNGFGGFDKGGKEYLIHVNNQDRTPLPWTHILANSKIGTLLTSNGGGYSWYGNSRENKISSWSNDVVFDNPSEKIILKDSKNIWSAFSDNIVDGENFDITYGFGYANYKLNSSRYEQNTTIFVSENPYQKVNIVKLKNLKNKKEKIRIEYNIDVVLGVDKEYTKKHLVSKFNGNQLEIKNSYSNDYSNYKLILKIITFGDEQIFENIIDGEFGIYTDINMEEKEEKEIVFLWEYTELNKDIENKNLGYYKETLENIKNIWNKKLNKIQVKTPVESMNIILNGWLIYQVLVSRIWGRVSFYQSGGAFGFRDQLQDMISILYIDSNMVKEQIRYHAEHQFKEGDVLHWWHPERNNGIRTRFSDDLLWLSYVACEYVDFTNDFEFLFEQIPFIEGEKLKEDEDEKYIETQKSNSTATLIEHCLIAIEKSLKFGTHGLPLMGSGDWNDGMNLVDGESVWLGFFLVDVLKKFLSIVKNKEFEKYLKNFDNTKWTNKKEYLEQNMLNLKKNLEKAWDGRWFRRAYFKDGTALGSNLNDECKIDNISQSWSVISNAVTKEKQEMAMESVENYLVNHENMLIKLLTPAFSNTKMQPGYIKAYIPGVRENGGQYTHAAIWTIIANSLLGNKDRAIEYFRMLNPIEHCRTKEDVLKYKVEPYVISADIYSHSDLIGRGGWSWYTGSASWFYIAGLKYILGINKIGDYLQINPSLPKEWNECKINYFIENTEFEINIIRKKELEKVVIYLDNTLIESNKIKINLDEKKHKIEVYFS